MQRLPRFKAADLFHIMKVLSLYEISEVAPGRQWTFFSIAFSKAKEYGLILDHGSGQSTSAVIGKDSSRHLKSKLTGPQSLLERALLLTLPFHYPV